MTFEEAVKFICQFSYVGERFSVTWSNVELKPVADALKAEVERKKAFKARVRVCRDNCRRIGIGGVLEHAYNQILEALEDEPTHNPLSDPHYWR